MAAAVKSAVRSSEGRQTDYAGQLLESAAMTATANGLQTNSPELQWKRLIKIMRLLFVEAV